jgi:hypothetical protein
MFAMSAALAIGGCRPGEPSSAGTPAASDYLPTATIRELMHSVIDPSADIVWLAVQTQMTNDKGTEDIRPKSDEDWDTVRRGAVTLMEAANLLMIPGRPVAHPGEKSFAPGVELEPAEIAELIAKDRNSWNARARVLHEVLTSVVAAVDARDAEKVFELGAEIEAVCESCHRQFWYPGEVIPAFPDNAPTKGEPSK